MRFVRKLMRAAVFLAFTVCGSAATNEIRLGIANYQQLIFNLSAPVGLLVDVEFSTNLVNWSPLSTNLILDDSPINLQTSSSGASLFLRASRHEEPVTNSVMLPTNLVCAVRGPPDDPFVRDANIPGAATPIKTIRLLFHVLAESNGSNPAVTNLSTLQDQVNTLNEAFRPSRLQFVHAVQFLNSSYFRHLTTPAAALALKTNALSAATQHNIFVTETPDDKQDRSTFPWDADALVHGGTVTSRGRFGGGEFVLVHELGHALGLLHTHHAWEQSQIQCIPCNESDPDRGGDRCPDTAGTPVDGNGTPIESIDRCTSLPWATSNLGNYMSAAPYRNVPRFTARQAGRMHAWITNRLSGWLDTNTPAAPSDFRVVADSFGETTLSWTDNSWNETGFLIERSGDGVNFTSLTVLPPNATTFTDRMPLAGINNFYRVSATNSGWTSYLASAPAIVPPPLAEIFCVPSMLDCPPDSLSFPTVLEAYDAVTRPTLIRIQAGTYAESLLLSNKVLRLEPVGGSVILGTP